MAFQTFLDYTYHHLHPLTMLGRAVGRCSATALKLEAPHRYSPGGHFWSLCLPFLEESVKTINWGELGTNLQFHPESPVDMTLGQSYFCNLYLREVPVGRKNHISILNSLLSNYINSYRSKEQSIYISSISKVQMFIKTYEQDYICDEDMNVD